MERIIVLFILLSLIILKDGNAQGGCDNFTEVTYHIFGQYKDYEHGSWELIFEDDFNDTVIDKDKWFTCIDGWNREHGSNELQYYLDDNVVIEDGILKLTAKREPGYYDVWRFDNDGSGSIISKFFEYTSGWIQTKMNFQYGLYEVRCRIPDGQGFWPAFWLYGNGEEIDIFEFSSNEQKRHLTTIHKWYDDGNHEFCPEDWKSNTSFANDFHKFSLEWDEFVLIFRVDGVIKRIIYNYYNILGQSIGNYQSATDGLHTRFALFPNNPQSIILNLAIPGQTFGPPPSLQTVFPSSLDIDYVKVYKKTNPNRDITLCDYNSSMLNNYTGKTIKVAGNCNVIVSDGENLQLIACDEIVLNDGFDALEGSNVNLKISSTRGEDDMMVNNCNNKYLGIYQSDVSQYEKALKDFCLATDAEDVFSIHPNPNYGHFQITLPTSSKECKQIQIFNMYGNLIYNINNPVNHIFDIDIPRKNGLYVVKCFMPDKVEIKRFIIN